MKANQQSLRRLGAAGVVLALALAPAAQAHETGTVVGWGANGASAAQPPQHLDDVLGVAAGKTHSVALRADRSVVAWGNPFYGGQAPAGLGSVVAIAASDTHTLFVQ